VQHGEYKFWLRAPGASSFSVLRDYGAAAFTWNTTGLASGIYTFGVWARTVGSSAVVDAGWSRHTFFRPTRRPAHP